MKRLFSLILVSIFLVAAVAGKSGEVSELLQLPVSLPDPPEARTDLRLVFAEEDGWPVEAVAEKIENRLHALARELLDLPAHLQAQQRPWEGVLSPDFAGTLLQPENPARLPAGPGLELFSGTPSADLAVTAASFDTEWRRFLAGYLSLRHASFRLTSIEVKVPGTRAGARILYAMGGFTRENRPRQDQGVWETEWVKEEDSWRLARLQCREFSRQESSQLFFQDVTGRALGRNRSFHAQLNQGAGYWARQLDIASGMDFYRLDGIAVGDFDNDGWEDVYVCQPGGLPNRLFRNRGDGTFEDVTAQANLDILDATAAALWADYDNDGDQDLFLIGYEIFLFQNDGQGGFKRSERARFEIPPGENGTKMSAALADYDRDGFLDLYVCQYSPSLGSVTAGYLHQPTPYHDANNGPPNQLFRNNGDGTFTNVTVKSGLNANNQRWSFAAAWADYNGDGYPDLYVANDFGRNNLYRNKGDGTFTDVAAEAGMEDVAAGMSAAWADYDNDGLLDLYISNIWSATGQRLTAQSVFQPEAAPEVRALYRRFSKGNTLYRNRGQGIFEETTLQAGVENGGWAWGSDFLDLNNDGWEDLYVVNGYITNDGRLPSGRELEAGPGSQLDLESFHWRRIAAASPLRPVRSRNYDRSWRTFQDLMREAGVSTHAGERNRVFLNTGQGRFMDVSGISGLDFPDDGRAFGILDFDHDGALDLVIKNRTAPELRVLRNQMGRAGHAVAFELVGRRSNRDAVGARVRLQAGDLLRVKEVRAGSGFLSQHTRRLYFGLGENKTVSHLQIAWPGGLVQEFRDIPSASIIRIEEGGSEWTAKPFSSLLQGPGEDSGGDPPHQSGPEEAAEYRGTWLLERVPVPNLELRDARGQSQRLLDRVSGRAVFVNLTAPDCAPCSQEAGHWETLVKELGSAAVIRIPVNASPSALTQLNTVVRNLFARRVDVAIPLTLLLDGEGSILKIYRGVIQPDWLRQDLGRLSTWSQQRLRLALPFEGTYLRPRFERLEEYFWMAYEFMQAGFYDEALRYFQQCLEVNPDFAKVLNNMGSIYMGQGRLEESLKSFQKALQLEPELVEIRFNIGTVLALMGELEKAVQVLDQAASMDPSDADIWNNLGNAYLNMGRRDQARPHFERALRLDPKLAEVHNNLGIIYGEEGMLDRALDHFQKAVQLQPDLIHAYRNLGLIYLHRQDRSRALEMFRKVIELDPNNTEARRLVKEMQSP